MAVEAKSPVSQFCQIPGPWFFSSHESGEDQVKYGGPVVKTAGRQSHDGGLVCVAQQEHGSW